MQIIQTPKYADMFLNEIAISLQADALSWEGWYGLRVMVDEDEKWPLNEKEIFQVARTLRTVSPFQEGTILCLRDGSLFAFYQNPVHDFSMQPIMEELARTVGSEFPKLQSHSFNLREERSLVIEFAERHLGELKRNEVDLEQVSQTSHMLMPHAGDFLDNWMTICDSREGREVPHILVIDDDPIARRIARNALADKYPLSTARNAAEGIEKHLLVVPDIVFLDIGLPDADGFMVLSHIHSLDPECTVVMFSGNSFLDNRVKALSSGAGGFLPKPFNKKAFEHYISDWEHRHIVQ